MDRFIYLTEFNSAKSSLNSQIVKYTYETGTDCIYEMGETYADIFGSGDYYKLTTEQISENTFELYADTSEVRRSFNERVYPLAPKPVSVQEPMRKIIVYFPDGEMFRADIRLCSKKVKDFYLGGSFSTKNGVMHAKHVEFIS
ncbi:MAG: hypothetical protein K6G10_01485 [Butyrivibrio sp.]|nr:hypothetical protein [Butyrivibrio sp.]